MYHILHPIDVRGRIRRIILFQIASRNPHPDLRAVRVRDVALRAVEVDALEHARRGGVVVACFVEVGEEFLELCVLFDEGGDAGAEELDGGCADGDFDFVAAVRRSVFVVVVEVFGVSEKYTLGWSLVLSR